MSSSIGAGVTAPLAAAPVQALHGESSTGSTLAQPVFLPPRRVDQTADRPELRPTTGANVTVHTLCDPAPAKQQRFDQAPVLSLRSTRKSARGFAVTRSRSLRLSLPAIIQQPGGPPVMRLPSCQGRRRSSRLQTPPQHNRAVSEAPFPFPHEPPQTQSSPPRCPRIRERPSLRKSSAGYGHWRPM